ncbi:hypothetical protein CHUAL_007652 [Chamberlinius hualienensis]
MTFEDFDNNSNVSNMLQECAGKLVAQILHRAQMQNRIVSGMYQAAKQLARNPAKVSFCILPQNHLNDVEKHLNYMLMEAFCNENDIYKLKVDCEEKLARIVTLNDNYSVNKNGKVNSSSADFSCILVEQCWSNDEDSWKDEEELIRLLEENEFQSDAVIELPPD